VSTYAAWARPASVVLHLATQGSTAALCGITLHDAVIVSYSYRRLCARCERKAAR
jgi:hypothetical protein